MKNDLVDRDLKRQLAEAENDVANRMAMQRLQEEHCVYPNKRDLQNYLWFGDPRGKRMDGKFNGNVDKVPAWLFEQTAGCLRMFAVSEDAEVRRLKHPKRFHGEWRRTTYKELAKLCSKSLNGISEYQIKSFLRIMEGEGIITRHRSYDRVKEKTTLYIRFNADRLLEIITKVIPQAKKKDNTIAISVKNDLDSAVDQLATSCRSMYIDNGATEHVHVSL